MILEGIETEPAADIFGGDEIKLDDTTPVVFDIAIAIGCFAGEEPFLHAAIDALADIDRHLFGAAA